MRAKPILGGLVLLVAATTAWSQDKVAYHVNDAAQALASLRNIRNHLDVDPTAQVTVVTHAQGVDFLMEGAKDRNGSPYVFPARRGGKHLISPKKAWANLLARAGIGDLRMHDLRRSLGSWQAINGASLPVIGKSLGHRSQASTSVYARMDLDPVRESVNRAVTAMMLAAEPAKQKGR